MSTAQLVTQIESLPDALKAEVEKFVESLAQKQKKSNEIKERKLGCGKGFFKMSPDFDEPLEDFKDYM